MPNTFTDISSSPQEKEACDNPLSTLPVPPGLHDLPVFTTKMLEGYSWQFLITDFSIIPVTPCFICSELCTAENERGKNMEAAKLLSLHEKIIHQVTEATTGFLILRLIL